MIAGLYIDSAARRTIVIRIRVRVEFIVRGGCVGSFSCGETELWFVSRDVIMDYVSMHVVVVNRFVVLFPSTISISCLCRRPGAMICRCMSCMVGNLLIPASQVLSEVRDKTIPD